MAQYKCFSERRLLRGTCRHCAQRRGTGLTQSKINPGAKLWRMRQELQRGGGLLPNLIGRAVGGLVSSALSSLSAQLEEAAREQAGVYDEAVSRLQGSAKLRARFGPVTVGPVMSQSSSTSSINGVVTKQVALMMPVYGNLGASGTAQVNLVQGPQQPGGQNLQITVRTSDGAVIVVDDDGQEGRGGRGGRGSVIDVEFREVDRK